MNDKPDRTAHDRKLHFFGMITASVSHELNNVISIIDQVAGLLSDLIAAADSGYPINLEKLKTVQERIRRQTQRGVGIIKRLNKFSHSVDEPFLEFDPGAVVENLMALAARFAELKKVTLETNLPQGSVTITNNPFTLQQAVFFCFRHALDVSERGETLRVAMDYNDSLVTFHISNSKKTICIDNTAEMEILQEMMGILGGSLGRNSEHEMEISVPLSLAP